MPKFNRATDQATRSPMLPDLESLRCFEAAARHGHFRRASAVVGLSPTAFSERIRRLEGQLNAQLFERTTRQVALTAAGLRLLPQAQRTLEAARQCAVAVGELAAMPAFELTIGTRFELGLSWLVPALEPLRAARPERTLHLRFGDSPELMRLLHGGGLDALVSSVRFSTGSLTFAPLHEEDYALVAQPEMLAAQPLRGPEDAPQHTLLDAGADLPLFRYCVDAGSEGAWWAFARTELLGTIAAIRIRVLQGAGVAVLPRYFVRQDLHSGALVEPIPELALGRDQFRLIWAAGHPLQGELVALAEALRRREVT